MRRFASVLVAVVLVALPGCDWSMFGNGPAHTGSTSTENAIRAPNVGTLIEKWSASNDIVTGGPVESGGVVFDRSSDGIRAFDSATGAVRWTAATNGPASWPSVANGLVYAGSRDHFLYAFDAEDGHQVWRQPTVDVVAAPTIADGLVFAATAGSVGPSTDQQLYAFDAASGAPVWNRSIGEVGAFGQAGAPTVANGSVFIGSYDGFLRAFDVATGDPKWSVGFGQKLASTAPFAGGRLYVSAQNLGLYALHAGNGTTIWGPTPVTDVVNPLYLNIESAVIENQTLFVSFNGFAQDRSFFAGLAAFDAGTGALRWRIPLFVFRGVSVANGVVYAGTRNSLTALDAADGSVLLNIPGTHDSYVAISNGRVYADGYANGSGSLHSYGLP